VKTYAILMFSMGVFFLLLFGIFEVLDVPGFTDPDPWFSSLGRPAAAALGVALLTVDVLLPVPASFVMVLNGSLFGVAGGTLLSTAGGLSAAALGFALGRWGGRYRDRWASLDERRRADHLLARYGELAVIASRPVPILAESVSIIAGTTELAWGRFMLSAAAGTIPVALLYAVTGATAARFDSGFWAFGLVILVAGAVWFVGKRLQRT